MNSSYNIEDRASVAESDNDSMLETTYYFSHVFDVFNVGNFGGSCNALATPDKS